MNSQLHCAAHQPSGTKNSNDSSGTTSCRCVKTGQSAFRSDARPIHYNSVPPLSSIGKKNGQIFRNASSIQRTQTTAVTLRMSMCVKITEIYRVLCGVITVGTVIAEHVLRSPRAQQQNITRTIADPGRTSLAKR